MATENAQRSALDGGLKQLVEAPKVSLDKTSAIREVFDGFASICPVELKDICPTTMSVLLNGISSGKVIDLLETYQSGFCAVFYCPELATRIIIGCDRRFVFSMIEAMCGGEGSEAPLETYRPFTDLEKAVLRDVLIRMSAMLQRQMAAAHPTTFVLERADGLPDPALKLPKESQALIAQYVIQLFNGGGSLFVLVPQSVLPLLRSRVDDRRPSEPSQTDVMWSHQLQLELERTVVDLYAVLEGTEMTANELTKLRPGQILALNSSLDSSVHLEAEEKTLFTASLRQSQGHFTVCIEKQFDEREQLLSDIFGP